MFVNCFIKHQTFIQIWCWENKYFSFPNKLSLLQVILNIFFTGYTFIFYCMTVISLLQKTTKTTYKVAKKFNILVAQNQKIWGKSCQNQKNGKKVAKNQQKLPKLTRSISMRRLVP